MSTEMQKDVYCSLVQKEQKNTKVKCMNLVYTKQSLAKKHFSRIFYYNKTYYFANENQCENQSVPINNKRYIFCKFCSSKFLMHSHKIIKNCKVSLCFQLILINKTNLIKLFFLSNRYELQCRECKIAFTSMEALENHMQASGHTTKVGKANYSCQYCGKQYQSGANLFSHIRMQHRVEAKRDGIVNIDEIGEEAGDEGDDDGEC